VDRNPYKGQFLARKHIPILHPDKIRKPSPTICHFAVEFQRRDHGADVRHSRRGRQVCVPIPEVTVYPKPVENLQVEAACSRPKAKAR